MGRPKKAIATDGAITAPKKRGRPRKVAVDQKPVMSKRAMRTMKDFEKDSDTNLFFAFGQALRQNGCPDIESLVETCYAQANALNSILKENQEISRKLYVALRKIDSMKKKK